MTEWGGQCQFSCLLPQSAQHPPPPAPGERPLSPSQHPKSHLHLPFLGEPWGGHDPACLPKPGILCLCGCPPLPATWPSQRLVGSEAGGGLGCANGSPPSSPPSCLPVLVISALRRLLPPLQFLCQAKGRTTLTGAPHPHPGAAAGQGAGCSVKDPPPTHPAARASPFFRAAHGWRLGPQRCVCVTAGGRLCDMPGGLCLLPGAIGGGVPCQGPGIPVKGGSCPP